MFATLTSTRQNTPVALVATGSLPRVDFEQSTPVTVNSNLPSLTAWFSPTAWAAASPDDAPLSAVAPLPDDDGDEPPSPPPLVAMAMMTTRAMTASRMKRFFLKKGRLALR